MKVKILLVFIPTHSLVLKKIGCKNRQWYRIVIQKTSTFFKTDAPKGEWSMFIHSFIPYLASEFWSRDANDENSLGKRRNKSISVCFSLVFQANKASLNSSNNQHDHCQHWSQNQGGDQQKQTPSPDCRIHSRPQGVRHWGHSRLSGGTAGFTQNCRSRHTKRCHHLCWRRSQQGLLAPLWSNTPLSWCWSTRTEALLLGVTLNKHIQHDENTFGFVVTGKSDSCSESEICQRLAQLFSQKLNSEGARMLFVPSPQIPIFPSSVFLWGQGFPSKLLTAEHFRLPFCASSTSTVSFHKMTHLGIHSWYELLFGDSPSTLLRPRQTFRVWTRPPTAFVRRLIDVRSVENCTVVVVAGSSACRMPAPTEKLPTHTHDPWKPRAHDRHDGQLCRYVPDGSWVSLSGT